MCQALRFGPSSSRTQGQKCPHHIHRKYTVGQLFGLMNAVFESELNRSLAVSSEEQKTCLQILVRRSWSAAWAHLEVELEEMWPCRELRDTMQQAQIGTLQVFMKMVEGALAELILSKLVCAGPAYYDTGKKK